MNKLFRISFLSIVIFFCLLEANAQQHFTALEKAIIHAIHPDTPLPVILNNNDWGRRTLATPSIDIDVKDPLLPLLINRLLITVKAPINDGVGIAAPQVGINRKIFLAQRFDKVGEPFECFINPEIISYDESIQWGPEGCLSIPNLRDSVPRSKSVLIKYWDREGNQKQEKIEGFTAIIIQHEYDHLLGILFPQRILEYSNNEK